jgi:hypothetical protein
MDLFPRTFLLVFFQLCVGGFLSLSIPPFHEVDRGYYKSSAAIYLLFGILALIGRLALWTRKAAPPGAAEALEIALWALCVAAATAYLWTLWSEPVLLRARLFTATLFLGMVGLIVSAESYVPSASAVSVLLYPFSFIISALLLGAASAGMLLGHWYLIDRDLSLDPLNRILRFYVGCLVAQALVFVLGSFLLSVAGGSEGLHAFGRLAGDHRLLVSARVAVSPIGAAILAAMIRRTLQIPQTMAATGLFYIAILAVMVGEFMGRYILFRTGVPL